MEADLLGPWRNARRPSSDAKTEREIVELLGRRALPDIEWLKHVTERETGEILVILSEITDLVSAEQSIHRALQRTGRTYYAQFPAPLELYLITRTQCPRDPVESGVSSGLSSAHILMGLERNARGRLHSIDLPQYQKAAKRARGELSWSVPRGKDSGWAIPSRLKARWDLRKGRSEDVLPRLINRLPSIDLYCHDSPWTPEHLAFEFETIRPKLRSGSRLSSPTTQG